MVYFHGSLEKIYKKSEKIYASYSTTPLNVSNKIIYFENTIEYHKAKIASDKYNFHM